MHWFSLVIALGVGLSLAGPLQSQQVSFDDADADKDGRLSRDEYLASRERQFDNFDTNDDGVISSNDLVHMPTPRTLLAEIDRLLGPLDTNGDRVITRAELQAAGTPMFDRADSDQDGFLTEREMASLRKALAKRRRSDH